jgi:FkbM family methyltransferase
MPNLLKRIWKKATSLRIIDRRYLYKYWEREHLSRLLRHYDVDCVFDIGANNGQYAKMLRKDIGYTGLIISFEPNPAAADVARRLARGDSQWVVEELAVSVADGEQIFNVMKDSQFSSLSTPRNDETDLLAQWNSVEQSFQVKTETLTTAYERLHRQYQFRRPFLKMDTQGYDVEIIEHAGPALANFIGLQSEIAVKKLYQSSVDFREAILTYENHGFDLSAFVPNNGGHFPWLLETDCIMIRRNTPTGQRN